MDVVEKVARALKKAGFSEDWQHANECARAAIAAMLEAMGEPEGFRYDVHLVGVAFIHRQADMPEGWTETPLYSLSPLTQALAASDPPHNRP